MRGMSQRNSRNVVRVKTPGGVVAVIDATISQRTLRALKAKIERRIKARARRRATGA